MRHNGEEVTTVTGGELSLFLNLYLGHLLGDFLFQPGKLVLAKRSGAAGLLTHTAIIGVCCTAALIGDLSRHWIAIALIVVAHAGIELITIATYKRTPTRGLFTFTLDQSMHVISILAVVLVTDAWRMDDTVSTIGFQVAAGDLILVLALLVAGLLGSILVFETANVLLAPKAGKGVLLRFDATRVIGIAERAASLALMVWVGPWALAIPFLPRLALASRLDEPARNRRLVTLSAGAVLVSLVYVLLVALNAALDLPILP